jgi:V-type H+-transporting ATPase subunit B
MAPDPRLSDKELAVINAAAVTQEYHVQPHLGVFDADSLTFHN